MITISEEAQAHFVKLLSKQESGTNIRVFVVNPGTSSAECGVSYCPPDAVEETDTRLPFNGFDAVVDEESAPYLEEAEIDYVTDCCGEYVHSDSQICPACLEHCEVIEDCTVYENSEAVAFQSQLDFYGAG